MIFITTMEKICSNNVQHQPLLLENVKISVPQLMISTGQWIRMILITFLILKEVDVFFHKKGIRVVFTQLINVPDVINPQFTFKYNILMVLGVTDFSEQNNSSVFLIPLLIR